MHLEKQAIAELIDDDFQHCDIMTCIIKQKSIVVNQVIRNVKAISVVHRFEVAHKMPIKKRLGFKLDWNA